MKRDEFALAAWSAKCKTTRRARFLTEMDAVIPWTKLQTLVAPHFSMAGNSPQEMPLERMLRVYFMQQWFNLSDAQTEDALYDIESMRRFAGIEISRDIVPDEAMILRFRLLLKRHRLTEAIVAEASTLLEERGLLLKSGAIVDATIVNMAKFTNDHDLKKHQNFTPNRAKLTNRQAEILHLILDGNANNNIAQSLGISEGTVKQHVHAIFGVLGVSSRTQAVIASMQHDFFADARNGVRQRIASLP